jgi:hypothetical protein
MRTLWRYIFGLGLRTAAAVNALCSDGAQAARKVTQVLQRHIPRVVTFGAAIRIAHNEAVVALEVAWVPCSRSPMDCRRSSPPFPRCPS